MVGSPGEEFVMVMQILDFISQSFPVQTSIEDFVDQFLGHAIRGRSFHHEDISTLAGLDDSLHSLHVDSLLGNLAKNVK